MLKIVIRVVAVFLIDPFNKKIEHRFIQFKSGEGKETKKKCQLRLSNPTAKKKSSFDDLPLNQIDHF